MTRKLGAVLAVGAIVATVGVVGTPVAKAYTGFCDTAAKSSERITCHQACDELMDRELCHTWEAIIDAEHGD
jgi:hypothetical protein